MQMILIYVKEKLQLLRFCEVCGSGFSHALEAKATPTAN